MTVTYTRLRTSIELNGQDVNEQDPEHHTAEQCSAAISHDRLLYLSHFLSTWNSRLFEFGAFLFLSTLYRDTLLPASIYALTRASAATCLAPWLGTVIDRHDRLLIIRISIVGQRLSTLLSCLVFLGLHLLPEVRESKVGFIVSLTWLSLLACIEKLSIVVNTISVERDWIIEIAGKDDARLTRLNARMRRIDLFCKLAAPLAVSFVDAGSTLLAIAATIGINALSCLIEYIAIARVYQAIPSLRSRSRASDGHDQHTISLFAGIRDYANSSVLLPSLALSMLYLTVLSFAGQLITFLLAKPVAISALLLSVLRGIAACVELSATFLAPRLIERIGLVRAGSWFLNTELIFICGAAAALWLSGMLTVQAQTIVLLTGVVLSRFGLWGFDLAAQQQIQAEVGENNRGSFSAVEAALQNAFEVLSFAITIIWPEPESFRIPAAISAAAVLGGAVLYAAFVRQRQGHLLHWEQCLCGSKYWATHFGEKPVEQAITSLTRPG